ncbi:hypothetical protein QTI06_14655 [Clostridium perfringens]|nr:hypothetical protein [Clostridium perfringens]
MVDKYNIEQDLIFLKLNVPDRYDFIKEIINLKKKQKKEKAK